LDVVIQQCERLIEESVRPRPETLMRLALARALRDDAQQAREAIDEGLRLAREFGGAFRVADSEVYAGAAFLYMGDADAAAMHLHQAVVGLRKIGESSVRSTAVALLGEALLRIGDISGATDAAEESRALSAEDDLATQMAWRQVSAKILWSRGEREEARQQIREALAIAEGTDFLVMAALVHLDAAEIMAASGETERSARELDRAKELLRRKGASSRLIQHWSPGLASDATRTQT
jgi:tetratricopeptide (TPR) repeat protein